MHEDSDERKLRKKGQTEMKHRILSLYLNPWIKKVSTVESELLFVDGFAGPGRYPDGSRGSPLIAMDMADKMLSGTYGIDERLNSFDCIFVEYNPENFDKLQKSVREKEKKIDDRINPKCIPGKFEKWATAFIDNHRYKSPPPSLIFIDPFGYGNIPFELISDLYQLRDQSLELLITFMAGKMAQWMGDPSHQKAITAALGTNEWQNLVTPDLGKDERAEQFSSFYQHQLKHEADAKFTMPFEMVEETKRQVCYYLIHVTNHWQGLKVMKETMFNAGAEDEFAYLGPDHTGYEEEQMSFAEFGETDDFEKRIADFADDLYSRYKGEEIVFQNLLEQTLDKNVFKITHYRDALRILENDGKLEVGHRPHMENGNKSRGYGRDDILKFVNMSLESFI
ncbi:three-Cys-motif partner protein TcmP [Halomicrobium sp. IBSBa]|uniref:three-Cys-motif partner protein TcmP n=1 Tax=Halomicrobium sp. IBSBa TaxID=2778916 RepID=UPI001ABF86B1|nr:three-Cys-motif partner protein TcmP [Halomicrobium sp. IBSBa]MBO4248395.1 three-Cys-motif partner protein TcmP [Halomicrobium sp. IBSBa]